MTRKDVTRYAPIAGAAMESAVDTVVAWSNGGLTRVGAEDCLRRWKTLRQPVDGMCQSSRGEF